MHSLDYAKRFREAQQELAKMIQDGSLKRQFHIVEGVEKCPEALPMLFSGGNIGKLCVLYLRSPPRVILTSRVHSIVRVADEKVTARL